MCTPRHGRGAEHHVAATWCLDAVLLADLSPDNLIMELVPVVAASCESVISAVLLGGGPCCVQHNKLPAGVQLQTATPLHYYHTCDALLVQLLQRWHMRTCHATVAQYSNAIGHCAFAVLQLQYMQVIGYLLPGWAAAAGCWAKSSCKPPANSQRRDTTLYR